MESFQSAIPLRTAPLKGGGGWNGTGMHRVSRSPVKPIVRVGFIDVVTERLSVHSTLWMPLIFIEETLGALPTHLQDFTEEIIPNFVTIFTQYFTCFFMRYVRGSVDRGKV
jgi:hypothetical protein